MRIEQKLTILAEAAKYDVSCASSGSRRKNKIRQLGNAAPSGICHTYTEDGRCVSLLKILLSNSCIYDCAYCVNRSSNDIPRAAFTPGEVVALTIDFYRRNYIEGLFLSSGVIRSPDETMERLIRVAKKLREEKFNGYIHVKCVPHASEPLIRQAGLFADRLSVNIELPTEESLIRLTGDKTFGSVIGPMDCIRENRAETAENRKRFRHTPSFAPAGQSTQLIVGASPESDLVILSLAERLYRNQELKRVYYSAYVPVAPPGRNLPAAVDPPLRRENRLYQADWLMRLYGFSLDEVVSSDKPHLDLDMDPKQAFALRHPELFPVDINAADRERLLRVPGIGLKSANRIVAMRRKGRVRLEHLKQIGVVTKRAWPYILCDGQPTARWPGMPRASSCPAGQPESLQNGDDGRGPDASSHVFVTDGTFDGLLTAVYESYAGGRPPGAIEPAGSGQVKLFQTGVRIETDADKSNRVWAGLEKHLGREKRRMLFDAYLSGAPAVESAIFCYIRENVRTRSSRQGAVDVSCRIKIEKLAQKVRREAHRMKGFVRFNRVGANQYIALVAPRYDVLPLIRGHFEARYADQDWIIYDTGRNYGLSYNRRETCELRLDGHDLNAIVKENLADEDRCRKLWQRYYETADIRERRNPGLHLRRLPRRFWRYLPEKQKHENSSP
jgi:probable DNA metabolism protein